MEFNKIQEKNKMQIEINETSRRNLNFPIEKEMIIKKVRNEGSQKKITIPSKSNIKVGDYVEVVKIDSLVIQNKKGENVQNG